MSYNRPSSANKTTVPKYPSKCMACNSSDTDVVMVRYVDESGRSRVANGRACLDSGNGEYFVKPGFEFRGWITRCGSCYMREQDVIRKRPPPASTHIPNKDLDKHIQGLKRALTRGKP